MITIEEALLAKAQKEYEKAFSNIPADVVEEIAKLDPSTQLSGEDVINIGFIAKQLLFPHYLENPTIFDTRADDIKKAVAEYRNNISKYPKPQTFASIEDFLTYIENPDDAKIPAGSTVSEDPISKIYKKYYEKNIPDRDTFDFIISLDPQTSPTQIGELARNLLLRRYIAGETNWFTGEITGDHSVADLDMLKAAIARFNNDRDRYSADKRNVINYKTIDEFVNYLPESILVNLVSDPESTQHHIAAIEGVDFKRIACTNQFEVFKILTFRGSEALAHVDGMANVWCTAGGSAGTSWGANPEADPPVPSSMWTSYTATRDIYMILSLTSRRQVDNFNLAVNRTTHKVTECRDGHNNGDGDPNGSETFNKLLGRDSELISAIANSANDDNLKYNPRIAELVEIEKLGSSTLYLNNLKDVFKFIALSEKMKGTHLSIKINVPQIPAAMFEGQTFRSLEFGNLVTVIGPAAFKNAVLPKGFQLPENLEIIKSQAFANATMSGSIRLPDSLEVIEANAFIGGHGYKLKLNKFREKSLHIAPSDREWAYTTIQLINGRDA